MKKSLALLAVALLVEVPAVAHAQGGLAFKGGLSYGNVSNGGLFPGDNKQRTGVAAGLGLWTGGSLGFGVEGLYAQRGITARKLDYIDVPGYVRLEITNPAISPFAYAGPQASFELKCDADAGTCPSGRPKTTYAGVIGAGLRFGSSRGFSIEGRYIYGLTDLKLNTVTTSDSYKTRSFLLLAGIGF